MRRRACFANDLRDDAEAIVEYERLHKPGGVWPQVIADLRARGYAEMSIWRTGNRLLMIAEMDDRATAPAPDPVPKDVLERWDAVTSGLQQALPGTGSRPTWQEMTCVFDLRDHGASSEGNILNSSFGAEVE